jgi:hypothetical protein
MQLSHSRLLRLYDFAFVRLAAHYGFALTAHELRLRSWLTAASGSLSSYDGGWLTQLRHGFMAGFRPERACIR